MAPQPTFTHSLSCVSPAFLSSPCIPCFTARRTNPHTKPRQIPQMHLPDHPQLHANLSSWGLSIDPHDKFGPNISVVSVSPPLLRIENFLTPAECHDLIRLQSDATDESDLYLNYRINKEVNNASSSTEAETLIGEFSSSRAALDASMRSGFRAHVPPTAPELAPVLARTQALMGFDNREFVFEEGMWTRPNRRTVVVRDQTTVRYDVGEGVAPHVDGKDATLLICLQSPEGGGRTVFPEEGIAVKPVEGTAIIYQSKKGLLHFAEAVKKGRKWVLQLLIDFKLRADEMDVDYSTGKIYS